MEGGGMFANWEGEGGRLFNSRMMGPVAWSVRGWSSKTGGKKKKKSSDEIPLSEIGSIR